MRHKHADLIHAWAEGSIIQRYSPVNGWEMEKIFYAILSNGLVIGKKWG